MKPATLLHSNVPCDAPLNVQNITQQDYDDLVKRFNELNEKYFALQRENRLLIEENQTLIRKAIIG
jgi:hypothetical protein